MEESKPTPTTESGEDPRHNLFWLFISVIGISIPKQGQERRALAFMIFAVLAILALVTVAILTLFHFW